MRRTRVKKKPSNRKSMLATGVSPIKKFLKTILPFLLHITFLGLMFMCATLWPSLLALPYFIFFIFFMTKWSVTKRDQTGKFDYIIKLFLVFYLAAHILLCYLYQFHLFQMYTPPDSLMSRLLGFNEIFYTKCEQPAHFYVNINFKWQQIVYPFVLLSLYWFLTIEFSYANEKGDQDWFLSPPRSTPIPPLPSVAIGREMNEDVGMNSFKRLYHNNLTFVL